jgi:hypothetical protein
MNNPSISKPQAEIDAVFGTVVGVLGETFGVEDLLTFIRLYRQRPLYFKVFRTPPEWNNLEWMGACFAAADQDVLLVQAGLDDLLFYSTLGHESAHLLSNHVKTLDSTVDQLVHNSDELVQHLHLSEYEEPQDGVLFTGCLIRHACSISEFDREFYGND